MTLHIPAGLSLAPSSQSCCIPNAKTATSAVNELSTTSISTVELNRRIVPEVKSKGCYSLFGRCLSSLVCGHEKAQDVKAKAIFKGFLEKTYGNKTSEDVIDNLTCYASGSYLTLQDLVAADLFVKRDQTEVTSDVLIATENTSLIGITLEETRANVDVDSDIELIENADSKILDIRQESESILENSENKA